VTPGARGRRVPAPRAVLALAVLFVLAVGLALWSSLGSSGSTGSTGSTTSATCALATLPRQAGDTVAEIQRGGPFPYRQDGVTFDNRERLLPPEPLGYYHEYTVTTPGSSDRGTRRVIAGGSSRTDPDALYYTGNHYLSFCRLLPTP
jgi:ribonuclease T1